LPPYLIARSARFDEEFEIDDEHRIKKFIRLALQKYAFVTICLCASVPNPLFDFAGLMAGHFGIPFIEFFLATLIGKALVKVQIQVFFVALMFSGNHLEVLFSKLEQTFPALQNKLSDMIKRQKESNFKGKASEPSALAYIWELFIILMVLFFVISLLNSLVRREQVTAT
jgi:vacuole membrane protein 1